MHVESVVDRKRILARNLMRRQSLFRFPPTHHRKDVHVLLVLFLLGALLARPVRASDSEPPKILASAPDGFTVTASDLAEMKKFFTEHTPFEAPEHELERYTVCAYLLAREADRSGLSLPQDFQPLGAAHTVLARAQLYFDEVLKNYPLDPLVVESYYKAHFEEFADSPEPSTAQNTKGTASSSQGLERARKVLLQHKQRDISWALCDDLKAKYGVKERASGE